MKPDDIVTVNGSRDLMMDRSLGKWINHQVTIVKICKSGLYQVRTQDNTLITLSKRNLTP